MRQTIAAVSLLFLLSLMLIVVNHTSALTVKDWVSGGVLLLSFTLLITLAGMDKKRHGDW